MSETITTPVDAPAPSEGPGQGRPPAALTDNALSISEAARLLASQRRREANGAEGGAAGVSRETPAQEAPRGPHDDMAAALGLQPGTAPPESTPEVAADGYEIDGRRYSNAELKSLTAAGQDYTRKTQALAEQQRALAAQQEALASVVPYLQPELERLQAQIQGAPPPARELAESNPQEYLKQLAAWQHAQSEQQRLGQLNAMTQQAQAAAMQRAVEQSNVRLAEQFPQWANPETRAKWQQNIAEWALEKGGYSKDELRGLTDHRHLVTMMKAMSWDRMLAGAKGAAPVPRVQGALVRGAPPPPPQSVQVSNAEQAFEARPNVRNAAALLGARRRGANGSGY